jgi:hypothetical protein
MSIAVVLWGKDMVLYDVNGCKTPKNSHKIGLEAPSSQNIRKFSFRAKKTGVPSRRCNNTTNKYIQWFYKYITN